MDLGSLVILLLVGVVTIQFWRQRSIAEYTVEYAKQYCTKHKLQYMSLARNGTKIKIYKGRLDWQLSYLFEFSSDGEMGYAGTIVTHGKYVISIELPAYRIEAPEHEYLR